MSFKHVGPHPARKYLVMAAGLLVAALSTAPAFAAAPLTAVNPGPSSVVVKNYWGHDMTFDINGAEYTVPADGQLPIVLPPGDYTFSANVAGDDTSARSGEVVVAAGEKLDLAFAATIPVFYASVEEAVNAGTTTTGNGSTPTGSTTGTGNQTSQPASAQPSKTGLMMKNFWGGDMTLNIGDTQYTVPANGSLFVALTPGDYTYSTSVADNDQATQNGDVTIVANHTVTLNSYLNSPFTPFIQ